MSVGSNNDKSIELAKYRDLVIATIDYYLENKELNFRTPDFDSEKHYDSLKIQTQEHFDKGRLSKLKQWFRDLSEMFVETGDFKFNNYLQGKFGAEINIFEAHINTVNKIIAKGRITTDNQYYSVNSMVDQLCQMEPTDIEKIETLNKLLADYNNKQTKKTKANPNSSK